MKGGKMERNVLSWITIILVIIGALNWGLFGVLDFNLVATLFGSFDWLAMVVYILIGLAGIWDLIMLFKE
jgi:uncharacterized membrane protein YuzA (DUF378 family)